MMRGIALTVVVAFIVLGAIAPLSLRAQGEVRVYVYATQSPDGFIDSARLQSSVDDIREALSKQKGLRWVFGSDTADLSLEVVSSGQFVVGKETQTTVGKGIFGGLVANTTSANQTLPGIKTVLRVKGSEYEKEISHIQQLFWKDLAKRIASQVSDWVSLNRAKIAESRKNK
jgi:hypothetical protein